MLKIAIYMPEIARGGSERFATVLANGLVKRGYDIRLLTGVPQEHEYELVQEVHRVIFQKQTSLIRNAISLRRYLIKETIDHCITIGFYPNIVGALANTFLESNMILTERNAPKEDRLSRVSKFLRKLLYWRGNAFVFQTPEAMSFYSRRIQNRGVVIPNPLVEGLPRRSHTPHKEIVAVGRLSKQKNYPLLLSAFKMVLETHSDYILRIFGKGDLYNDLLDKVRKLGIKENVRFEGFADDVHEKIRQSDIFVMTSDYEGLPNSLMEAMAMGFPVICTDCPCGGPRMLIGENENGLITPVNDPSSLSYALLKYIESPTLKEEYAEKAFVTAQKYQLNPVLNKWEDLFYKLNYTIHN